MMKRFVHVVIITLCFSSLSYAYDRQAYGGFKKSTRATLALIQDAKAVRCFYSLETAPLGAMQIEHIVPVAYVDAHGGATWPTKLKHEFYNDTDNLVLVIPSINASKGDKPPWEWMPDYHREEYLAIWRLICGRYGIDCDYAEIQKIINGGNK